MAKLQIVSYTVSRRSHFGLQQTSLWDWLSALSFCKRQNCICLLSLMDMYIYIGCYGNDVSVSTMPRDFLMQQLRVAVTDRLSVWKKDIQLKVFPLLMYTMTSRCSAELAMWMRESQQQKHFTHSCILCAKPLTCLFILYMACITYCSSLCEEGMINNECNITPDSIVHMISRMFWKARRAT